MGASRQQYEDRIRSRLGDFGVLQLISEEQLPLALEEAIMTFSNDRPRRAAQTFAGNGAAFAFNLAADVAAPPFVGSWSRIVELEYPAGGRQRSTLSLADARLEDNGTTLTLVAVTPATGQNLVVRYTTMWPYPTDTPADDAIPTPYFNAVASLAGSKLARWKGVEHARQASVKVATQIVQRDPAQLFSAADGLAKSYTDIVLGRADGAGGDAGVPNAPALAVTTINHSPDTLFHDQNRTRPRFN